MQLCIVGAGYVGLVTGACLADAGHQVACVDKDAERVAELDAEMFRALDLARIRSLLLQPLVIDLRNVFRPADMRAAGFRYHSIGRIVVDGSEVT